MRDVPNALLDVIAQAIKLHAARLFTTLDARLRALEEREPPKDGKNGEPGRDGKDGIDGKDGKDGEAGRDGVDGKDGKDAMPGKDGRDGRDGKDGAPGNDGRDGTNGAPGVDGRDAFALDVLPTIDFARSYARGTVAHHAGGLWRAHANTDGPQGWSCIVDGIATIDVQDVGERSFTLAISRSSGAQHAKTFNLPMPVYRGVFAAGRFYEAGDMVTWAGSLWHCNATTDQKPGDERDAQHWTLAAKRGRDGKDMRTLEGERA